MIEKYDPHPPAYEHWSNNYQTVWNACLKIMYPTFTYKELTKIDPKINPNLLSKVMTFFIDLNYFSKTKEKKYLPYIYRIEQKYQPYRNAYQKKD